MTRPTTHVLVLMTDQLNFRCLGYKGHPLVKTPHLDRLKQESAEFTRCYVQNAFCAPSRTSYMTGQYLHTHRQYGFHGLISEDTPSMPLFMTEHGYNTFHVGKAHLNCMGERLGFERMVPTLPEDIVFSTDLDDNYQAFCISKGYPYPTDQVHGGISRDVKIPRIEDNAGAGGLKKNRVITTGTSHIPIEDSLETYVSNRAIAFLHQQHEQPFFLHVSFDRPHHPLSPSEPYDTMYDPATIPIMESFTEEQLHKLPLHIQQKFQHSPTSLHQMGESNMRNALSQYYGLITHIDHEIGRIVQTLKDQGLYDQTLILFYSDHGDMASYNGMNDKYSNTIFHDHIIRTPMLVKWPDQQYAGQEIDDITEAIDVFPTIADICGLNTTDLPLQGRSLNQRMQQQGTTDHWSMRSALSESYVLKTIVQGDWKLIYYVNSSEGELYNLADDPLERNNLYLEMKHSSITQQLKMELVRKFTPPVSQRRKAFIRELLDESATYPYPMMDKFHKWTRSIAEGDGFWVVTRGEHRLVCVPFDNTLRLQKITDGITPCDDTDIQHALMDELIHYLAVKIRPISLMSGDQQAWDNVSQTKGFGLC